MLRHEFEAKGDVVRATAYITGLGLYDLRLNGERVGDRLLAPEWTVYPKTIQYQTYDVTPFIKNGANVIGVLLGGGWWTESIMAYRPVAPEPQLCLLMRLEVEYAGGERQAIVSGPEWSATTKGPIRRNGIYFGEIYDEAKELPGWDRPGFDSAGWNKAVILPHPNESRDAVLRAQMNEPIRVVEEVRPVAITEPSPGEYIFDMGQNIVGWCQVSLDAAENTKLELMHGEVLYDDGQVNFDSLWTMPVKISEYNLKGGPVKLEPHFTYYGFRYVLVKGLSKPPSKDLLLGKVFHSDAPVTGRFESSSELLNRVMAAINWTQKGNMMSVPTDCPQRVERAGWMGDAMTYSQTAMLQMDMAAFYTKWLRDIRDSQADDGRFSDYAPRVQSTDDPDKSAAPAWADAGVILPWLLYVNYGDTRILREQYDAAKKWVDYVAGLATDHIWREVPANNYGDWMNTDLGGNIKGFPEGRGAIPKDVFATAFFAY